MSKRPSKIPTIPFAPGFNIKPKAITNIGTVTFTDGVNENIVPNQRQCEKYGYTYDPATRTCYAFKYTPGLTSSFNKTDSIIKGDQNILGSSTSSVVLGQANSIRNSTKNNIVTGEANVIDNDIINSVTLGTRANTTTSGSITLGGNQLSDNLAERQTIILQYGCQTTGTGSGTGGGTISSGINNLVGTRFVLPENAIIYFHADTIAVRTGGTSASGAVGDFYSAVERGVMINKSGTCTISRERDTIKTSGTVTNWRVNSGVSSDGKTLALQCRGNNDMTIEWNITVTITMIQTDVSL